MANWSEDDLKAVLARTSGAKREASLAKFRAKLAEPAPAKPNKYRAIRTEGPSPGGARVFDSRKEARLARQLEEERAGGRIESWVPQVSLPMGDDENGRTVRYRADAMVVIETYQDGTALVRFADAKGRDTAASRAKRAALRRLYGLNVQVV